MALRTDSRTGRPREAHYQLKPDVERALRESVQTARRICDTVERLWTTSLDFTALSATSSHG